MTEPIIAQGPQPIAAGGRTFEIHEWKGSGPDYLHIHHSDDEAWHVLEGTLVFKFKDRVVEASAGSTVFVPAGVAHAYWAGAQGARYLIILTPRLHELISALQAAPRAEHNAIMRKFDSEIIE
jgi:quercetin dioxygenase-like cupin family protein